MKLFIKFHSDIISFPRSCSISVVISMFSWCSMAQALNGLGNRGVGGKGRGLGREGRDTCYKNPFLFISAATFVCKFLDWRSCNEYFLLIDETIHFDNAKKKLMLH